MKEEAKPTDGTAAVATTASVLSAPGLPASKVHPHPMTARFDSNFYTATDSLAAAERAWGLREGLRLEQPSFVGETDAAAIKRLLFQAALMHAADSGDAGDLKMVKKLRVLWYKDQKAGKKMFPLAYRGDAFYMSPLQTAVAYEDTSTSILDELLRLPILLHVQSRATEFPALTRATFCHNFDALRHLIDAGYNINFRDSATGATAIVSQDERDTRETEGTHWMRDSLLIHLGTSACCSGSQNAAVSNGISLPDVLKFTSQLLELHADPFIPDHEGNCALTYCVFSGFPAVLKKLLAASMKDAIAKWLHTPNEYGVYPMHYALNRQLPWNADGSAIVSMLISVGGDVDAPTSAAGLTPLQVWTGSGSAQYAEELAKVMKKDLKEVRQMLTAERKRWQTKGPPKRQSTATSAQIVRMRRMRRGGVHAGAHFCCWCLSSLGSHRERPVVWRRAEEGRVSQRVRGDRRREAGVRVRDGDACHAGVTRLPRGVHREAVDGRSSVRRGQRDRRGREE